MIFLSSVAVGKAKWQNNLEKGLKHQGSESYYIDSESGADNRAGTSPATAWKSLSRINANIFLPGDKILFKCGQTWHGQLHPLGNGSSQQPIIISNYGSGVKPVIAGDGVDKGTLLLYNQACWDITNLEITNYNSAEQEGISLSEWEKLNKANYVLPVLPPQEINHHSFKYGIYVAGQDAGIISHIHFINLTIHGVNGYINQKDEKSKNNGGMFFEITGLDKPTNFDDLLIDSCKIHDVDRTGILLCKSSWDGRTLTSNTNWVPSTNVVVRRCIFSRTGANALIVRVAQKPVMEHNIFDHCAIKGSGNAAFSFNCDNAIWQYNECRHTKANIADVDAGGIDADYRCKNTIIQYNYLHDNDYGMLITGGPKSFNDHTVLRYNIFENDGSFAHPKHGKTVIRVNGSATNTHIYNNVIYLNSHQSDVKIVSHETWATSPSGTLYQNNIFYNLSVNASYDLGNSIDNSFDTNTYFGNTALNTPADAKALLLDPLFKNPGVGDPKGYQLKKNSPAVSAGKRIPNNGERDFFGSPLPSKANPDIGISNAL